MKPIIPPAALLQHVAVLGKTRSGKSSVMRLLVEGLLEREQPVCIVDPKGDWWGIKLAKDGKRPGFPVVIFGGEHADVPINAHAGAHVAELFATGNRPCLIDLGGWMVGERTRFWIDFASTLFKHTRGQRWLVVDEVHNFAPKGKIMDPDAGKALHWTNRLASEGLGKGLAMLFASQRPQKVHNDTLTSAETLVAMRVIHPSDRAAISDWIKGCGDLEVGGQVLGSLAEMARGEGWVWSPENHFGPERVKFPMFKTYDSFRPQSAEEAMGLKGWAEVDLEDVKAKFATVVKEAQENDPKLLRKRNAELEAQMRRMEGSQGASPEALAMAKVEACDRGRREGRDEGWNAREAKFVKDMAGLGPQIFDMGAKATLAAVMAALEDIKVQHTGEDPIKGIFTGVDTPKYEINKLPPAVHLSQVARPEYKQAQRKLNAVATARVERLDGSPKLSRAQQTILEALAYLESIRVAQPSRTQLALWADVSPTSGGYFNNLGALRSAGLIDYPSGGTVALTDAGRERAPTPADMSEQQMQSAVLQKVGTAKANILIALLELYPKDIARDDLAGKINVSPTSGGYFNNLGALRTLGVIDYPSPGRVVALPVLFLHG